MIRKTAILAAMLMALAACGSGGAGGMNCAKTATSGTAHGLCSGTLDQLSGATTLTFDMRDLVAGNTTLHMKITVSVKTGAVTVGFINQGGQAISKEVSREAPLTLEGVVNSGVQVTLSSTHGISTGVAYSAEFTP
jgi:hypothetical protein